MESFLYNFKSGFGIIREANLFLNYLKIVTDFPELYLKIITIMVAVGFITLIIKPENWRIMFSESSVGVWLLHGQLWLYEWRSSCWGVWGYCSSRSLKFPEGVEVAGGEGGNYGTAYQFRSTAGVVMVIMVEALFIHQLAPHYDAVWGRLSIRRSALWSQRSSTSVTKGRIPRRTGIYEGAASLKKLQ